MLSGTHGSMVNVGFVRERLCLPPFHSRGHHRDMIYATALYWNISTDRLKAFAPEHLTTSRNVLDAHETIVVALT
jgi:hypothetical protein